MKVPPRIIQTNQVANVALEETLFVQSQTFDGVKARRFVITAFLLLWSGMSLLSPQGAHADTGYQVFIPLLVTEPACEPSSQEAEFEALFRTDPNQTRTTIDCDAVLSAVAQLRAQDMADRAYFDHVNPDGIGPNQLVRDAGYQLPSYYSLARDGNNVESIAGGFTSAQDAWDGLMGSPAHRRHLLGEIDFYREQIDIGIGYVYDADSEYKHYWVIITARTGD